MRQDGTLISTWNLDGLASELDRFNLWGGEAQVSLKNLWEYLASYPFLPRLNDENVMIEAIKEGVRRMDAPFGYATGLNANGKYSGLVYRELATAVYFDERSILVRADVAAEQKQVVVDPPPPNPPEPPTWPPVGGGDAVKASKGRKHHRSSGAERATMGERPSMRAGLQRTSRPSSTRSSAS